VILSDGRNKGNFRYLPALAVEHDEITRYGTLIAWADRLGMKDASTLLRQTLDEEKKIDQLLTQLALANINQTIA
jgi:ferritin-like metal-binding protein YciE